MFNDLTLGNTKLSLSIFRAHVIAQVSVLMTHTEPLKNIFKYLFKASFTKIQNLTFNSNRSKITPFEHHSNATRLSFE